MILTPIGKRAPTAGTPILLIAAVDQWRFKHCRSIVLQSHPNNSGKIFLLSTAAAADTTDYTNVLLVLEPGQVLSDASQALMDIDPNFLYVDVETTGAFLIGYGKQA